MFLGFSDSLSSNHRFRESCDTICICNAKRTGGEAVRLRALLKPYIIHLNET